jgi:hypothetical protein
MDCPPPDWDKTKKWDSITDSTMERVAAALEYFSICYPVCLFEAVQIDANGHPIKDPYTGEWMYHTHKTLGEFLGLHQSTVYRAMLDLKLRHRVDYDDGRSWLVLDPKPLSISERNACTRDAYDADGDEPDDDPLVADYKAILPKGRKYLAETLGIAPPNACTQLRLVAAEACKKQNDGISKLRAPSSFARKPRSPMRLRDLVSGCPDWGKCIRRPVP